jgi:glycine cleavage system aminomethyltransferase T
LDRDDAECAPTRLKQIREKIMAIIWRHSALAHRHAAIGGELEDWNGMGTAWFYDHTPERAKADYEAIRTKAGLMDVSGLKKVHLVGPDAAYVIDRVTTRNVEKIAVGRSTYASILNSDGKFIDDCIIYHLAVNTWMVVHGTGTGMEQLTSVAAAKNVAVIMDDDLHDMSLQGPLAVDFLAKHIDGIRDLAYFGILHTKLFGKSVMISRTGYTGERGYEIFVGSKAICCFTQVTIPKPSHSMTSHAATPSGNWVSSSRCLLAKKASSVLKTTMQHKAKSVSKSMACNCPTAWPKWKCTPALWLAAKTLVLSRMVCHPS